jgi:hypothetical protein
MGSAHCTLNVELKRQGAYNNYLLRLKKRLGNFNASSKDHAALMNKIRDFRGREYQRRENLDDYITKQLINIIENDKRTRAMNSVAAEYRLVHLALAQHQL